MAIRSGTFYWLVCDKCGYRMEDEFGALYHSTKELLELAESYGWDIEGERHLCRECADDGWDEEWIMLVEAQRAGSAS